MSKATTNILLQPEPLSAAETLIAMAVYHKDKRHWLDQAISSIVNQTYTSFIFMIVLDGDVDDEIKKLVFKYAGRDSRIIVAQNSENIGLAASMNFAIEWGMALSPKYFVRMDADDISVNNRLALQIQYLKDHPDVGVLGTALTEINESGVKVGARLMPLTHMQIVRVLPRRCSLNHPTVAFRYAVFRKGFRYDRELHNTQDYFLWIQLASEGIIFRNLSERLLEFRRVNNFYKRRGISKSLNEFRARMYAMKVLKRFSLWNMLYAFGVLSVRMMPARLVKLAYKLDRIYLEKKHKQ